MKFPRSLWDLLPRARRPKPEPIAANAPGKADRAEARSRIGKPAAPGGRSKPTAMQARYDALVVEMKREYRVRVRKWRSSTSGCAWEVHGHDGSVGRLIESPYPRGPMSCAIFMHEIGHHAIGFGRYRPRCLEEYHAWRFALDAMRERGFNVTTAVEKRMHDALRYAVAKAMRRGLKRLPAELVPYLVPFEAAGSGAVPGPGSGPGKTSR